MKRLIFKGKNMISIADENFTYNYIYAGFFERFFAKIIDYIICLTPMVTLKTIYQHEVITNFLSIIPLSYFTLTLCSKHQATLGQRALNIRLLSLSSEKLDFGSALGRTILSSLLPFFTLGGSIIMFFFNKKKQCLHDLALNVTVVKFNSIESTENQ